MRIMIVGCGDLGQYLGQRLAEQGHQVWGARRQVALLPEAIQPFYWDLPAPPPESLPEIDYLIYAVAADGRSPADYQRAYRDGVAAVLAALGDQLSTLKRFFLVSSTGVYHQQAGESVTEASPALPRSFSGQLILEGEALLEQAECASTCVRLSGLYGPGRERLLRQARAGQHPPAEPLYWTNRIHRDDAAAAIQHLMDLDAQGQQIEDLYLVSDTCSVPMQEVISWLGEQLGVPPQTLGALPGEGQGKQIQSQLLASTGFQWRYPSYREGYAALLSTVTAEH